MNSRVVGQAGYQLLRVELGRGETFNIERGGLMYYDSIGIKGTLNSKSKGLGGVIGAIGRKITTGESLFLTEVTGQRDGSLAVIAPPIMGNIHELDCGQRQFYLNTSAYLGSEPTVHYDVKTQSLGKALFGGTGGFFIAKTSGKGKLYINTFGDLVVLNVEDYYELHVDNEHVVAWEDTVDYSIGVASGVFGFTSGEGLVNRFSGRGKVLLQSRNIENLAKVLVPHLPKSESNNKPDSTNNRDRQQNNQRGRGG